MSLLRLLSGEQFGDSRISLKLARGIMRGDEAHDHGGVVARSIGTVLWSWLTYGHPPRLDPQRARSLPVPIATQEIARDLMRQDRKMQAIKEIRAVTGYDLRDAKDVAFALLYGIEVPPAAP